MICFRKNVPVLGPPDYAFLLFQESVLDDPVSQFSCLWEFCDVTINVGV